MLSTSPVLTQYLTLRRKKQREREIEVDADRRVGAVAAYEDDKVCFYLIYIYIYIYSLFQYSDIAGVQSAKRIRAIFTNMTMMMMTTTVTTTSAAAAIAMRVMRVGT